MAYEFYVNSNITFGRDAVKELSKVVKEYNAKKVMLVYDAGVKFAGIADTVLDVLKTADVEIIIFDKVIPNPTNEIVEEAAEIAKDEKVDTFVAVGGGSSIDLAKAINIPLTEDMEKNQYLFLEELLKLTKQLGIKTLSEQGMKAEDFDMVAEDVLREPVLSFNPRQNITKEDILNILWS